jgi:hypothetical protein
MLIYSQLTYLLQYSLGGNSKTLMFVMVSPLQAHLAETLTSLKFATKVRLLITLREMFMTKTNKFFRCITLTLERQRDNQKSRSRNHESWICRFIFLPTLLTSITKVFVAFSFFFLFLFLGEQSCISTQSGLRIVV